MNPQDHNEEMFESARLAWNYLSQLLEEGTNFEKGEDFKVFYTTVMSKLLEEEEEH